MIMQKINSNYDWFSAKNYLHFKNVCRENTLFGSMQFVWYEIAYQKWRKELRKNKLENLKINEIKK